MRFYYGDYSVFGGDWYEAPAWDLQAVAWPDPVVGTDFTYGRSFFILPDWMDGQPVSADLGGLYDYLRGTDLDDVPLHEIRPSELIARGVKFGRYMRDSEFSALIARIRADNAVTGTYPSRKPERVLV